MSSNYREPSAQFNSTKTDVRKKKLGLAAEQEVEVK
jgi:hypothetical protein